MPDSISIEAGRTFNQGSHLELDQPYRARNAGNEDSNYIGFTVHYLIKPTETIITNWSDFPQQVPLSRMPEFVREFDDPDFGDTPIDMLEQGLDVIEDTSWSTIEKVIYLLTALAVLGVVFFGLKAKFRK